MEAQQSQPQEHRRKISDHDFDQAVENEAVQARLGYFRHSPWRTSKVVIYLVCSQSLILFENRKLTMIFDQSVLPFSEFDKKMQIHEQGLGKF